MIKSLKWLIWFVLFLVMLLAVDQFFVQVPPMHPAHEAVSQFYQDFRSRLFGMASGQRPKPATPARKPAANPQKAPKSIEAVIDKQGEASQANPKIKTQRYVYSDADGQLQFAESLEAVPEPFRAQAQPMSR